MMQCPTCGAEVPEGAVQCPTCDAVLDVTTEQFAPVAEAVEGEGPALEGVEGPVLIVHTGREVGERFYLDRPEITIGRDPASDIFLNDVTVSRHHAVVRAEAGRVTVEDAGSLNGTYVNGVCVDQAPLGNGDEVQVGTFKMVFWSGRSA